MSQKTILALVEALREAGQREHGIVCDYGEATICPADGCIPGPCECGADKHNAQVDAAAKTLRAEIERVQTESFREQQRAEEDNLLNNLRTGSKA